MLGIAGAAAVAGDEQLAAAAVTTGDDLGDHRHARQEARVGNRALERFARTLEIPENFAVARIRRLARHRQLRSHDVSRSQRLAAGRARSGSRLAPTLCSISAG